MGICMRPEMNFTWKEISFCHEKGLLTLFFNEGKIHEGKIQQKTCIQRNKFNYLCCQLQIIVKDSKQLLRNAKAMSICDYFAVDSTSFKQKYFYISTAYEFFSKNVYFFAASFG